MPHVFLNTALVFAAQGVSRLIGFAYMLYLARSLAPSEFGALNLALSFLLIADVIVDCGLARLLVKDLSQRPDAVSRYLGNLLPYRLVTAFLAYGACIAIVTISSYPASITLCVAVAGIGLIFTSVANLLESVLQAQHRFGTSSLAHFSLSVVQAGSGSLVVYLGGSLGMLAATFVISNLVYMAIMVAGAIGSGIAARPSFDRRFILEKVAAALPFAGIGILFALSMRTEFLVLSWLAAPAELGIYSAASKFNEAAMLAPLTAVVVLTPFLSRAAVTDIAELRRSAERIVQYGLLAAVPGTALAIWMAGPVISLILPNYPQAVELVRILFVAFPFFSLYCVALALLTATTSQHATFLLVLGLGIVQVALSVGFISRFGITGAAMSFVVWSAVAAVSSLIMACYVVIEWRSLLKGVAPALLGGTLIVLAASLGRSPAVALVIASALACYGVASAFALRASLSGLKGGD